MNSNVWKSWSAEQCSRQLKNLCMSHTRHNKTEEHFIILCIWVYVHLTPIYIEILYILQKHKQHSQFSQFYFLAHAHPRTHTQSIRPFELSVLSSQHLCSFTLGFRKREMGGKNKTTESFEVSSPLFCQRTLTRVEEEHWWEQEEMAPNWLHEEEEDRAKQASW